MPAWQRSTRWCWSTTAKPLAHNCWPWHNASPTSVRERFDVAMLEPEARIVCVRNHCGMNPNPTHATRSKRDAGPNNAARAAALMLASTVLFGLMAVAIRLASQSLHTFEVAFFRNFFGLDRRLAAAVAPRPVAARNGAPAALPGALPDRHLLA
jgi:hypothetical protein